MSRGVVHIQEISKADELPYNQDSTCQGCLS